MRCLYHPLSEVVGYCHVCGVFGCSSCMTEHKGAYYCQKHFRPIAEELAREKRQTEARSRPDRQRLVVHTRDNEVLYGVCLALNPSVEDFILDCFNRRGEPLNETKRILFSDLKGVFYVKSYDGRFDPERTYIELEPEGPGVVVEFHDGETITGHYLHPYRAEVPRFFIVPESSGNIISILVERAAVRRLLAPEEYKERYHKEIEEYAAQNRTPGQHMQELIGDFHFERHDFSRAIRHYRAAIKEIQDAVHIQKKVSAAEYNIGVRHIKRNEYDRALKSLRRALEIDPTHERAAKKIQQITAALERRKQGRENLPVGE